jgi:Fe2+ or Zn2+ uptake regulation protein
MKTSKRNREEIVGLLAECGLNLTAQRIAIAEYVLNSREHPNAEDIYQAVTKVLPVVSKATVYNTLNLLVRNGLLRAVAIEEGAVHYDPLLSAHPHFLDTRTHRIIDIPSEQVLALEHRIDPSRFEVDEVQVVFRGRIRDHHQAAV